MKLPGPKLPLVHLQPGELLVTTKPQWVITLLGSCVAVTMFSRSLPLAAICHGMLPRPGDRGSSVSGESQPFRYMSCVIPAMLERFRSAGLEPQEIEVKVFGGANVIHLGGEPSNDRWIGTANVAAARLLLHHAKLTICSGRVGGNQGCKIVFNTHTGEVLHKHLSARVN